ncbi:MAG: hypothetical protein ACP5P9_04710 [Acidimicrobiales bacterium]
MTDTKPSPHKTWRYRFVRPGGDEVGSGEFDGDEAAIVRARDVSRSVAGPVVVERYGMVDWHYVDEVDEHH